MSSTPEEPAEEPTIPIDMLAQDPVFSVLFASMKLYWSAYYCVHAALLRHMAIAYPEMEESARVLLISKCAEAAAHAARRQPPTATKLYQGFKDTCGPVLRELGASESEISDLESSNDA